MSRPRDTQKSRVYAAERAALRVPGAEPDFRTLAECQAFIDGIVRQKLVRDRFPRLGRRTDNLRWRDRPVVAVERPHMGQRAALAYGRSWRMTVPVWARSRWVLLHELTHLVLGDEGASHGWEFAEAYLWLVRRALGVEAHDRLKAAYREHRVRFRPKRRMTDEQRAAAAARLAAYRSAALTPEPPVPPDWIDWTEVG